MARIEIGKKVYGIGDRVIIRKDLERKRYGTNDVAKGMLQYAGKEAFIIDILNGEYFLNIDNGTWSWTGGMFEEVNPSEILFAKLKPNAITPSKREEDGAFDIYACFDEDYVIIQPHETKMIPTGLCSAFSHEYVAILKERGSTGTKGMGQRAGVVDSGYRGEWFVPITNHNNVPVIIDRTKEINYIDSHWSDGKANILSSGDAIIYPYEKAISQCVMVRVPQLSIREVTVDEILAISSERGTGALGSSGK